jgi:stage II sporulation protein P
LRKMTFVIGYWPGSRRRLFGRLKISFFLVCLVGFFGILVFLNSADSQESLAAGKGTNVVTAGLQKLVGQVSFSNDELKGILQQGMPMLEFKEVEYMSPIRLAASVLSAVTTVDLDGPAGLLKSQISYMEEVEVEAVTIPIIDSPSYSGSLDSVPGDSENQMPADTGESGEGTEVVNEEPGDEEKELQGSSGDNPLVGIYNTHNSENYSGEGKAEKVEGRNGGVVRVAEVLEKTLKETYNVPAVRSLQIHDYPDWNLSYTKSKETGKSLLSKHPSIQVLLDIHRDAGIKEKHTVEINGRKAAKVLIIVGSAQRLENPNWKKNKEFAEKVDAKMDELYPGLSRGVRVQSGRYNQHLHPHAILLEMGNAKNSLAEAEASAELMAHVISEVLKDLSEKKL